MSSIRCFRCSEGTLLFGNSSDDMGGRGGMTTPPIRLQDLRRRIYVMTKADKTNRGFGWKRWSTAWFHERLGLFGDYRVRFGLRPKALLVDRSHNPWREADRRAAYGK